MRIHYPDGLSIKWSKVKHLQSSSSYENDEENVVKFSNDRKRTKAFMIDKEQILNNIFIQ